MKRRYVMREREVTPRYIKRRTIVSLSVFLVLMIAGVVGWRYLYKLPEGANGAKKPLRAALDANESLLSGFFSSQKLAKTFPASEAVTTVRLNGGEGVADAVDTANWRLHIAKSNGDTLLLSLDDIKSLPKEEEVFNFKCIEGWSQVTRWGGVRWSELMKAYHLDKEAKMKYAGLSTPNEQYYVGIDMKSAMHPQTLLCYELNGKPLPKGNGFPLRLIITVKYGVKNLKQIGTMFFSNTPPPDYWAERGYDYYSGL